MDAWNSPSFTVLQRKEHNCRGFAESCCLIIPCLGDNRAMNIGRDTGRMCQVLSTANFNHWIQSNSSLCFGDFSLLWKHRQCPCQYLASVSTQLNPQIYGHLLLNKNTLQLIFINSVTPSYRDNENNCSLHSHKTKIYLWEQIQHAPHFRQTGPGFVHSSHSCPTS